VDTHPSSDRTFVEFAHRCAIVNECNPENRMPYFPAEQDWTMTMRPERIPMEEHFPAKFAINNPQNGKARQLPTLTKLPWNTPLWNLQTHGTGNHRENPNLIPINRTREEGKLS